MLKNQADLTLMPKEKAKPNFAEVVDRYWGSVYRWIYPKLRDHGKAEDAAQEVFLRAWKGYEDLRDPNRVAGWLFRIAFRVCAESFQRVGYDLKSETATATPEFLAGRAAAGTDQTSEAVQSALELLDDEERLMLVLRYYNNMTSREIALELDQPLGTVLSKIHRANQKLKTLLERFL